MRSVYFYLSSIAVAASRMSQDGVPAQSCRRTQPMLADADGESDLPPAFGTPDWPDGKGDNPLYTPFRYGPDDPNAQGGGKVYVPTGSDGVGSNGRSFGTSRTLTRNGTRRVKSASTSIHCVSRLRGAMAMRVRFVTSAPLSLRNGWSIVKPPRNFSSS